MSIYVGNLSYNVTREDLEQVFNEYGAVKRVSLPMNRETGKPRGFAFVDMAAEGQEDKVIEALDGAEWMGREMKVNKALPRDHSQSGPGNGNGQYRRSSF
ncbi:MAG: RNA-binding protein [Cyanobacteria bacterium REEB459]|nr:RNA-binding protein [Cyanobacteria bacterium REEB459]